MRKIDNIAGGEIIETLFIFETREERSDYLLSERSTASRAHREKLDELRRSYLAKLQDSPDLGDIAHQEYMRAVKAEYERFARELARVDSIEKYARLEADLARAPVS